MGVQMSGNPNSVIKEGFVQRWKSGLFSSKWKSSFAVLHPDSTLALFNERGDSRPAETIFLKNVVPYICVGYMTDRMPTRRPSLPPSTAVTRLVGIGMDPQASRVHWLLFPSEQVLEEWLNAVMSTLPRPASPQPNNVPVQPPPGGMSLPQPASGAGGGFVPPAKYPDGPPPPYGPQQPQAMGAQQQPYQQPQQAPYGTPQQYPQPQQTIVIDRTGAGGGGYSSRGSGLGTGLAAGMGGAMLGSLLGYGIGSMFAPHGGWGGYGGGGWGGSSAPFGGGYVQDNDTYITNNYYDGGTGDHNSTPAVTDTAADTTDYSQPAPNDYDGGGGTWDDGGGDYDYDGGGGGWDSGGFDGGGGDW